MKNKWLVAIADNQEMVDNGAYEVRFARSKAQAIYWARHAIKRDGKAAAYALKHSRTVFGCAAENTNVIYDGLRCREWTPFGTITFVPDPRINSPQTERISYGNA